VLAECRAGFFHHARTPDQFPAIGDWVAVRMRAGEPRSDIHAVLPRRTKLSRRAAGKEDVEQVLAANVDTVFLVAGLDRPFNAARLQRFLVAVHESGATPVVVLNKADLCEEPEGLRREAERLLPGVAVHVTSTTTRKGLKALASAFVERGRTLAVIGPSGVGKSSLINALVRDAGALPTGEVREKDSKGRHTTTRRELVSTPSGALVIDTPGMRELQLWEVADGVENAFAEIEALALRCRFGNCGHTNEPGCAVRAAVESGEVPAQRLEQYRKLKAEKAASAPAPRKPSTLKPERRKTKGGALRRRERDED